MAGPGGRAARWAWSPYPGGLLDRRAADGESVACGGWAVLGGDAFRDDRPFRPCGALDHVLLDAHISDPKG